MSNDIKNLKGKISYHTIGGVGRWESTIVGSRQVKEEPCKFVVPDAQNIQEVIKQLLDTLKVGHVYSVRTLIQKGFST